MNILGISLLVALAFDEPSINGPAAFRVDSFIAHYTGMDPDTGQPRYLSLVVPEYLASYEEAKTRASQITTNGLCWGDAVITCYPADKVQKVLIREMIE